MSSKVVNSQKLASADTAASSQVTTTVTTSPEGDEIMHVSKDKNKKKKKHKKEGPEPSSGSQKRVRFDLSQNKVTEFFKHGKVATRTLPSKHDWLNTENAVERSFYELQFLA